MIMQEKINVYICTEGHESVTVQREVGTTPFMMECLHKGCTSFAQSTMHRMGTDTVPTHEWYKPVVLKGLSIGDKEHVQMGGLLLKRIETP